MKWLTSLFGRRDPDDDRPLEQYRKFRALGRRLNVELIRQLPPPALPECGKKLGLYKAGTLILNQDDEIAVAYDYCLQHYRRAGKNAIERALSLTTPADDSDERVYLQTLSTARFALFRIIEILPRRGARLLDLVTGASIDIFDMGLNSSGQPGVIVAGRLLSFDDFTMSSGTLIPVQEPVFSARLQPVIEKFWPELPATDPNLAPAQAAAFEAQILRIALHAEEDLSFYTDIES